MLENNIKNELVGEKADFEKIGQMIFNHMTDYNGIIMPKAAFAFANALARTCPDLNTVNSFCIAFGNRRKQFHNYDKLQNKGNQFLPTDDVDGFDHHS